ncbi:MAG: aldo/keto reductase [Stackebrandtia sp.]
MPAIVIPDVTLNDGTTIPQLGFGVFRVPDHEATPAVAAALEAGYRAIDTQAWSPLGHGQLISDPTVATIAERRGKTAAQILLRWNLELGNAVISKSVTPERIRTNMEIFGFELTSEDDTALATLDTGTRTGPDPEVYGA